ncbi:MAG: hypothetical protein JEZ09_12770 [Salinivirgaceae bacterium]|nr:hypothetical protein [Salinivirgaceae bacterium]
MDRRKFFRSIVQGGIFSGLAITSGYLLLKENPENQELCNLDFVCQNCKKNSHCKLPEASKFRLNKRLNR